MSHPPTIVRGLGLVLGLVLAAELALAESHEAPKAAWDRAKAAKVAESLAGHADALYDAFFDAPEPTLGAGQGRAYHELKHKLRRIRIEARHLATQLGDGKGEVETRPAYHDLAELFADARVLAQKIFVWSQLKRAAGKVRDDLNALAPLYGGRTFQPLEL